MEREELQQLYEDGDLDDPTELQRLRDEIHTYTGLRVPRSVSDIEEWWSKNKAVFARQVKPSELSEPDEDEESGDAGDQDDAEADADNDGDNE